MNLHTDLIPDTKINSKDIIVIYVKCKTVKFLEDNIQETLGDLGFGNDFFRYNTKNMIHKRKN